MTLVITDIRWKRAILELAFVSDAADDTLFLRRVKDGRAVVFEMRSADGGGVARLNLMAAQGRSALPEGEWAVCRRAAGGEARGVEYAPEVTDDIERFTRLFRYGNRSEAYAVSFSARDEGEGAFSLALEVMFLKRNAAPEKHPFDLRHLEKRALGALYRVIRFFTKRTGNRILFFKQNGEAPTDNMAALKTRLAERGLDGRFEVACRFRNTLMGRQSLSAWIGDFRAIARADYIFVDDYAPVFDFIELSEGVVLTQLWHAGIGFKSVGYARFGRPGSPGPFTSCHRAYTYALVGNASLRDDYAEVFGIEHEALLATGMPRLDHFLDEDVAAAARARLVAEHPLLAQGRVVLFAPTYRGAGQQTAHYPYEQFLDLEALHALCERTDSRFVFKMHQFVRERPRIPARFADRILDLSDEGLGELSYAADVLVTDYSSCFYDFQLLGRPVVFYTPDRVAYSLVHGVQRPVKETAPGVVCDDFEELLEVLETGSYAAAAPCAETLDRCIERSGLASDRVIDVVLLGRDVPGVRLE